MQDKEKRFLKNYMPLETSKTGTTTVKAITVC
jgi:hypothetical protein